MKKQSLIFLLLGAALSLLAPSPAASDVLDIRCTAPRMTNSGTCAAPALAQSSDSVWVYFQFWTRRDSVWRRAGGDVNLRYTVPAGSYPVRCWAGKRLANGSVLYGCDTTAVIVAKPLLPWRPVFAE